MIRVPFETIQAQVERILSSRGVDPNQVRLCAEIIATNSIDGVTSHGVTRLPHFVGTIDQGLLNKHARPHHIGGLSAVERWDGERGLGPAMATQFMARAMELARTHGIGCVAAQNTTHWLRGGTYGLQAAREGMAAICWTNARPGMPAWGGTKPRLGNNPIVFALPADPPLLVDMALSQFSYGKIQEAALAGRMLPVPAGYDLVGELTVDPQAILESLRAGSYRLLPIGYWKGAGLAFVLDAMAAVLSGGLASYEVESETQADIGISQVFIAIDLAQLGVTEGVEERVRELVHHLRHGHDNEPEAVRFPGEGTARQREENLRLGAPVDESVWASILAL